MGRAPAVASVLPVSIAPSCACVIKSLLGADVAMGQPKWAESASWWAAALFWTAERSPNVAERSEWGALRVFSVFYQSAVKSRLTTALQNSNSN